MKIYGVVLLIVFIVVESVCLGLAVRSIIYPIKYKNEIIYYANETGLSPDLVASVINVESHYKTNAKSSAGAIGLMQIQPSTAQYVCKLNKITFSGDLTNGKENIKIGTLYLKYLLKKFAKLDTALCAYNAGETVVLSWLNNTEYSKDCKTLNYIPYIETANYVKKIQKNLKVYKNYNLS